MADRATDAAIERIDRDMATLRASSSATSTALTAHLAECSILREALQKDVAEIKKLMKARDWWIIGAMVVIIAIDVLGLRDAIAITLKAHGLIP